MEWSNYSKAIFDHYLSKTGNIMVKACPGSGKTTNIKHLWTLDDKPTVYLVFNKANQLEAQSKMPYKSDSAILTLNGLGHRALLREFGSVLDDRKVLKIIDRDIHFPTYDRHKADHKWALCRAVQQAKSYALDSVLTPGEYADMVDTYDLETYEGMEGHVNRVLEISDNNLDTVDFDDQIRIPALYRCTFAPYANVLCDEVQDFSPIQALLVSRLQADRYVFVGDSHQSIYGFRGAMTGSMDYLSAQFHCTELPLSITYRCAKNLVKEAAAIYPGIEAFHSAPEGTVRYVQCPDYGDPTTALQLRSIMGTMGIRANHDAMVVCRMNRPLIQLAYALLAQDIPCYVRGRDIGQNLIRLITKQEATSIAELRTKLDTWYFEELALAQAKCNDRKIITLEDKHTSLALFMNQCLPSDSPSAVIQKVTALFEQGKGLCLSTIHKAKGLEAEQCTILEHGLYPRMVQRSSQVWQKEQEHNCQYVAITRGKTSLTYM